MAHNPPTWVKAWIAISTLVVFWDAGFCLLRPHSMFGGSLHHYWSPYALYEKIDLVYGPASFKAGEGFTSAQAILNLVENGMNITYLLMLSAGNSAAILLGFTAVVCTFWKTALYWLMDQQCGWCQTGHNDLRTWIMLWFIPNGLWLLMPALVAINFGREIASNLRTANSIKTKKA